MATAIVVSGAHESRPYRIAHYPVALIDRVVLGDGRSVLVRPVLPQDAEPLQAFVQRLSPGARYRRFHMGLRELPASVLRAFTELDHAQHLGLLAEVFDAQERQTVVADARLIIRVHEPVADAAIVVADDWQGLGLGRKLIGKLLQSAPLALDANATRTRRPIASASKSQSTGLVSMLAPSSSFT